MNISKKIFSIILVVATVLCLMNFGAAVSMAATPDSKTIEATAGETVDIKFALDNIYGVQGKISYSDEALFESITPSISPSSYISTKRFIVSAMGSAMNVEVTLKARIKGDATVGKTSTVTFEYLGVVDTEGTDTGWLKKTVTVKVIKKEDPTPSDPSSSNPSSSTPSGSDPSSSTPSGSDPSSSTPSGSSPSSSTPAGTTPTPSVPVVPSTSSENQSTSKLDLTELNKQINIAQGLKSGEYTKDSWNNLKTALNAAINARKASSQSEVDAAAKKLSDAIAALVRIDNTVLQDLLNKVKEFLAGDDLSAAKEALLKAIAEAEAALKTGDQDAINKAYENLTAAFDAYKAKIKELASSELIEVEKEVEVDPKGPFCNIWRHKLWLILLIVSVIINIAFIVLTVLYFIRRKKKYADNMPLVAYDISED